MTQSPQSPEQGAPGVSPVWVVFLPVVVGPSLLLAEKWLVLTLRLTSCEGQQQLQHMSCCVGADLREYDSLHHGSGAS